MESLVFIKKQGKEILDFAEKFARLRIHVFKDFPYLYEGTLAYELEYIQTYSNCEEAMVFAVFDGQEMVGATTCLPLKFETPNVQKPFIDKGLDVQNIFYFGESILLKAYRGQGLGHRFFDEREQYAKALNAQLATFCAVNRDENHPLKPVDYISNDAFWKKRGYTKQTDSVCSMFWQDIDEVEENEKTLTFWTKEL